MKNNVPSALMFLAIAFLFGNAAEAKKPDEVDVVTACKADCPDAKNNAEAHECVERKAKIRPSFKKTKCWEVNEEYEELVKAASSSKSK